MYIYINKHQQTNLSTNRLQPNRPANRCRCLLVSAKGEMGWRCCRKHTGVPQSSASLPKTCTKESYGAMENERERSVRIRSDNTSSSLRAIPSLSTSPSFYSFKKGAVSLINYPPNKPILLGSSLYLIPSYLHRRSRTREGPVRTRLCTDCARGRFSSRQRVCMGTHPY